jgi:hypothetical protein
MSHTNPSCLYRRRSAPHIMLHISCTKWKGNIKVLGHQVGMIMNNTMMFCYNEPQNLVVTVIKVDGKASLESLHTLLGIHLASRDLHLKTWTNRVFNTMKANTVAWGIDHMQYVGCCKGPKARCFHITYYLHHGTLLFSNSPTQLVDIEICALAYHQKIS